MRVLTDTEWERLRRCSMLAQTLYLFILWEEACATGSATIETAQVDMGWQLERRGEWASRQRIRRALDELERHGLLEVVRRRPMPVYRLPWIWPSDLPIGVISSESAEGAA
ncbi:hypothetical protein SAMN05660831_00021 [Thiohalospira halophila DSM 15071]|uniref:Uncharacterized protein n=1 Tax=Thiohalospira halophila DSM 15071 TaxID=1123397 RepID=A0A1I1MXU6_9GAMM|nr:hypothetical protein [Thiohalospira halophila]SFC90274.1 hypothetical protein SAMN05660831_00021 [Thiohalospira halophila DSM 15071]